MNNVMMEIELMEMGVLPIVKYSQDTSVHIMYQWIALIAPSLKLKLVETVFGNLKKVKNVMMEMVTIMMVAANFANYKTLINFTVQIIFTF